MKDDRTVRTAGVRHHATALCLAGSFVSAVEGLALPVPPQSTEIKVPGGRRRLRQSVGLIAVTEPVAISESLQVTHGRHVAVADTVTVSQIGESLIGPDGKKAGFRSRFSVAESLRGRRAGGAPPQLLYSPTVREAVDIEEVLVGSVGTTTFGSYFIEVSDDATTANLGVEQPLTDSFTIGDTTADNQHFKTVVADTLTVHDAVAERSGFNQAVSDVFQLGEMFSAGSSPVVAENTRVTVTLLPNVLVDGILDRVNYSIIPTGGAFPVQVVGVQPVVEPIANGSNASVLNLIQTIGSVAVPMTVVQVPTVNFSTLGATYLSLASPTNTETFLRILQVLSPTTVQVDRPLLTDPHNGKVLWSASTGITSLIIDTTKFTNAGHYDITIAGLQATSVPTGVVPVDHPALASIVAGSAFTPLSNQAMVSISAQSSMVADATVQHIVPFTFSGSFMAVSQQPEVVSVEPQNDGQILVTFSESMLIDADLLNPREYMLSGPGSPYVESVTTVSATQVLLLPRNISGGSYSLLVGTNTPHDSVGNPIDPFFDTVAFTMSQPINNRSIFTDYGPITRPALTLEVGVGVRFLDYQTVQITGASIASTYVGFQLTLNGTSDNDGSFLILTVNTQNTVKVAASFTLPDTSALTASWAIVDPRDGEIADDPAHVYVTVNGNRVIPEEVVGLLGQIVLPSAPIHGDDVQVGYSWMANPTVEIRRLNSKEFRLNSWNRDLGYLHEASYRFNNVLPVPTNFTTPPPVQQGNRASILSSSQVYLQDGNVLADYAGLTLVFTAGVNAGAYDIVSVPNPNTVNVSGTLSTSDPLSGNIPWTIGDTSDIQAVLPQPLLRDLKYRAFERAYTALLNDQNTLTLNAPTNLIAYPPLARTVAQTFVSYESVVLPQNDPTAPWALTGTGSASIIAQQLVVTSPTSGTFPGGSPIYWIQTVDQTFPHVFAATWDMQVTTTPALQGVFTGVVFGYSDDERAIVFGYLNNGGTHMIGFLKQGSGNDPSTLSAWTGGLDVSGNPTNAPLAYDWSQITSYRIYEDSSGNVSLYLNGSIIPSMQVTEEQLPFLEELAAPFNTLQGVFFGSISAQAENSSTWDFVRYLILPLNPLQTAPSIFVDYTANVLPESASKPWTPVGYHGTETIVASAFLLLDSTSAVPATEEVLTGLVGGDYRGFFRLEPLIATNAEVVVDFSVQLRTWTQGFSPNALMIAIDDSDRLIQLSFISDTPAPKFSYGGDGFPTTQTPPWTALGGQTAQMLGRTLQIVDTSATDGLVYVIDDTNPVTPTNVPHFVQQSAVAGSSLSATSTVHHQAQVHIAGSASFATSLIAVGAALGGKSFVSAVATVQHNPVAAIVGSSLAISQVLAPFEATDRVLSPNNAYILEARLQPITFVADPTGFVGAMAQVYDSQRNVGFSLLLNGPTPHVALQGDGTVVASFPFNWNDGNYHTYRVVFSPSYPLGIEGVVTLFVDGVLVGTPQNYTSFPVSVPQSNVGFVAFGSSSPGTASTSTVNWIYCNAWRVEAGQKFVGIWRGTTFGNLIDYWVPTKATGSNALVLGNALMDTQANFVTAGVALGDYLIVDVGANQGIYQVIGVQQNTLAFDRMWPSAPSRISYRIARQTDWTQSHGYRIVKAPSGDDIAVFLDSSPTPIIALTYDNSILPPSQVGMPRIISGTLPSIVWGAFDPTNLSQSAWQYFRYGVTRSPTELRIIPPHQILNQRNIIQSYERHLSNLPHTLTDFWSESEGITPNTYPDFLTNPQLTAYTLLNEGTPLVPQTQTYEVQSPQPVIEYVGSLNTISTVLNSNGSFLLNDATTRIGIIVPNDVLYSSLQIFERDTGQPSLIAPFTDNESPIYGPFNYQKEVCLTYDAQTLPENDPTAQTPWKFFADDVSHIARSVFNGVLTYGTDGVGAQTRYSNSTPLTATLSLGCQVSFTLKVLQDTSGGLGDSQVRFGFSAFGLTASLALVSASNGQRYVYVIDQNSNQVLGGIRFDFGDNQFHTYRLVRQPGSGTVSVFVDS